jgi:alkaline phosphatase
MKAIEDTSKMKRVAIAGLLAATALCANGAVAQEMPQMESGWYAAGQDTLQSMLDRQPITGRAKNIILLIADGNGVGTNYATRLFMGQQEGGLGEDYVLPYETADWTSALVKTYNINAQTPDSAPTAGSMNTGVKQVFNTINMSEAIFNDDCASEAGRELTTFSEMVTEMGKSVGVVSTARLTHATPAAVYAKTANRNWESSAPEGCSDIAAQLLAAIQAGTVDFAMGGGSRNFAPDGFGTMDGATGNRPDGRNLIEEIVAAGGQYAYDTASAGALDLTSDAPVLALFEGSHMKYEYDRADDDEPSLADMTAMAIEYLSQNDNGYYLEIEAGRIDHANHDGNGHRVFTDGIAFAEAVALADAMTDNSDTLIIVTADHEHAIAFNGYCGRGSPITGLCYGVAKGQVEHSGEPLLAADGKPYTVMGYLNGAGSVLVEQADGSYFGTRPDVTQEEATDPDYLQQALIPMSSETHSGEDVAVYAKGPWSHLFDGTIEQNYIFHVMDYAVTAE